MDEQLTVSIIVIDYNYGRFLAAAIDSALAQSWKNVEVIVVDDGSTDDSPAVIARYGDRIKALRKENGGQASAFNLGFRHSRGRLVILLDADDVLYPLCVERVVGAYQPGVAKIQYRLDTIDAAGRNVNMPFPYYPPDLRPAEIKRRALAFGTYPWPVASGNAFERGFLERVLPVPDLFKNIADGYLSKLAPLYGDVETISDILAAYRVHGSNIWAQASIAGAKYAVATRYELDMVKAFVQQAAELGYAVDEWPLLLNKGHLESRLLSRRLSPGTHPLLGEPVARLVWLGIRSAWVAPDLNIFGRALWSLWFPVIGFLPPAVVSYLVGQFRRQDFRAAIALRLVAWSRSRPTAETATPPPLLVSIVITSHNYGRFLREAIDSALGQTWGPVEVIVVDDGSTDDSRAIITQYGGRVRALLKENGGQTSAFNAGFAASAGEVVIFLDADDRLHANCVEMVTRAWKPGTAKLQYRLGTIDAEGRDLHLPFPHYMRRLRSDTGEARRQLLEVGTYAWPVASGNAFARGFLLMALPISPEFRRAPDGFLNRLAPLYGPVMAIPDILADYRVHGANVLAQDGLAPEKYAAQVKYEIEREAFFLDRARAFGYAISETVLQRNKKQLEMRLLSLRLCPELHPVARDRAEALAWLGIKSSFRALDLNIFGRLVWTSWFIALGFLPRPALAYLTRHFRLQGRRAPIARLILAWSRLAMLAIFVACSST